MNHDPYKIQPMVEQPLFDVVMIDKSGREHGLIAFRLHGPGANACVESFNGNPDRGDFLAVMRPCATVVQELPLEIRDVCQNEAIFDEFQAFAARHDLGKGSRTPAWIVGDFMHDCVAALNKVINTRRHHKTLS